MEFSLAHGVLFTFLILGTCLTGLFETFQNTPLIYIGVSCFCFAINMAGLYGGYLAIINSFKIDNLFVIFLLPLIYIGAIITIPLISLIFNPWVLWGHLMMMLACQFGIAGVSLAIMMLIDKFCF